QEVMQQQHPEVAGKGEIKDENYALVKRSCQFLKKGVAEGLSPAELSDAYLRHQGAIFDTPEAGDQAAFTKVIQDGEANSPMGKQAMEALPNGKDCCPVANDLVALGWDVPNLTAESTELNSLHQLFLSNPILYELRQKKVPNPTVDKEIAELQAS